MSPLPEVKRKGRPQGKSADPNYKQVTVYLRKDVYTAAKKLLIDDGEQVSELVDRLMSNWVKEQTSKNSDF